MKFDEVYSFICAGETKNSKETYKIFFNRNYSGRVRESHDQINLEHARFG